MSETPIAIPASAMDCISKLLFRKSPAFQVCALWVTAGFQENGGNVKKNPPYGVSQGGSYKSTHYQQRHFFPFFAFFLAFFFFAIVPPKMTGRRIQVVLNGGTALFLSHHQRTNGSVGSVEAGVKEYL